MKKSPTSLSDESHRSSEDAEPLRANKGEDEHTERKIYTEMRAAGLQMKGDEVTRQNAGVLPSFPDGERRGSRRWGCSDIHDRARAFGGHRREHNGKPLRGVLSGQ